MKIEKNKAFWTIVKKATFSGVCGLKCFVWLCGYIRFLWLEEPTHFKSIILLYHSYCKIQLMVGLNLKHNEM